MSDKSTNRASCFDIFRLFISAIVLIPLLSILYRVILQSNLFEDAGLIETYRAWPGLLDVIAPLLRERISETAIEISAGAIGAFFYPIFNRAGSMVVKTLIFAILVLIGMAPIGSILKETIWYGTIPDPTNLNFRFWNSLTISFIGGLASVWIFDNFLPRWNKWWDGLIK